MKQAITTVKPVRRLKRICHGYPHRAEHAVINAGFYTRGAISGEGIWRAIGRQPKQVIERILAHAEALYLKDY